MSENIPASALPNSIPEFLESYPNNMLSETQRKIFEQLFNKKNQFASMYYSSIKIINDSRIPDRLAYAALGLRELIQQS